MFSVKFRVVATPLANWVLPVPRSPWSAIMSGYLWRRLRYLVISLAAIFCVS